jgi:peptidoglycan/LPS O-acetylase OafA/YrhL
MSSSLFGRTLTADLGIKIFFVLSGFLITSLLIEEQRATGTIRLVDFYMRRSLRIFPLYFFAISILPALMYVGLLGVKDCTMLHAYTYTLNFAPRECVMSSYSHFWSLAVEEHFYLVWPLAFLMGRRLALIFMWAILLLCILFWTHGYDLLKPFHQAYYVNRWTIPAAAPIAMGCIASYYREVGWLRLVFERAGWIVLIACVVLMLFFTNRLFINDIVAVGIVLFVYMHQGSLLTRALEFKPLAWIGTVSYGLYVWQGVLGGNGPYRDSPVFPPPLYEGLGWALVATVASYYLLEQPIMRLKRYFSWRYSSSSKQISLPVQ